MVLFKVASSFWMWIFTKLGTGKGPAVVDHQPGQVHKRMFPIIAINFFKVYKIRNEMAPHSNKELLDAANNYTNILLVRLFTE